MLGMINEELVHSR